MKERKELGSFYKAGAEKKLRERKLNCTEKSSDTRLPPPYRGMRPSEVEQNYT